MSRALSKSKEKALCSYLDPSVEPKVSHYRPVRENGRHSHRQQQPLLPASQLHKGSPASLQASPGTTLRGGVEEPGGQSLQNHHFLVSAKSDSACGMKLFWKFKQR